MAITEWEIGRAAIGERGLRLTLCDDDPDFLAALDQELERLLAKWNIPVQIRCFQDPDAVPQDALADCDMIFLDIDFESEERNGIDLARKLRQTNGKCLVFFVTNFIDYAPAGFEVQAFRYILKRDRDQVLERYLRQGMDALAEGQTYLRLRGQDTAEDVPLNGITYLEVMDHAISVHTQERTYSFFSALSSLEAALTPYGFLRIHKSYLVNMAQIRRLRSRECLLTDGTVLSVGEKSYPQQKQKYLHWKGLK